MALVLPQNAIDQRKGQLGILRGRRENFVAEIIFRSTAFIGVDVRLLGADDTAESAKQCLECHNVGGGAVDGIEHLDFCIKKALQIGGGAGGVAVLPHLTVYGLGVDTHEFLQYGGIDVVSDLPAKRFFSHNKLPFLCSE